MNVIIIYSVYTLIIVNISFSVNISYYQNKNIFEKKLFTFKINYDSINQAKGDKSTLFETRSVLPYGSKRYCI